MTSESDVLGTQLLLPYTFHDLLLLHKALISGDSNSDDREGHRGMAQVGDALMRFVIMSEGFDRGLSRSEYSDGPITLYKNTDDSVIAEEQQDICSILMSKEECSRFARAHGLDRVVKTSERQGHIGPQPTVLKNTIAAIVAAVWLDSRDYRVTVRVMKSLW
jgi:dsRNA-specific ribonuclease